MALTGRHEMNHRKYFSCAPSMFKYFLTQTEVAYIDLELAVKQGMSPFPLTNAEMTGMCLRIGSSFFSITALFT